jgi:glycerol-3-phosphate O-acyltransferase
VLAERGLLEGSHASGEWRRPPPTAPEAMQLSVLAQATIQIVERYYLAISILIQAGSGAITPEALEKRCQLIAQRMSMLFELSAPEFFDRSLFASFIDLLRRRGVIQTRADNTIAFNEVLLNVAHDATLVLSEQIRHSILQVAHA